MIQVVIIDDEENSRDSLKGKLDLFCPEVEIAAEAGNVKDGIAAITNSKPDAVFLDIKLAGESGFDILDEVAKNSEVQPKIIFITAHDEFAIKAIKFSALDYLLKPIDPEELVRAIRKVEDQKGLPPHAANLNVLVENIRQASDSPKKIVVPTSDGMHVIKLADIIRLESSSNYTTFHLKNDKSLLASKTLKEFDTMLTGYNFNRVHKSHLVNMNFLKRYVQTDGGYLILEDGSKIPVANRKKEQLLSTLKNL
ncbi:MAG TPA: DNA-binding response regulator [Cryomorphaceae bacterium]|nr:DNA-binding response regulator [Owenweeksia sp.]MBG00464.1 DNA-binding response regulator [Owenweeksia sp.]HAD97978.1 DNA-binding response regulator [Cryomorphaceae bacterium]HBF18579.1 DNA-binding response regulator [Cryomorphaceae bacterium]HCQ15406.1 DNA-binding response regulator [Cryomorphaceae bacterium]